MVSIWFIVRTCWVVVHQQNSTTQLQQVRCDRGTLPLQRVKNSGVQARLLVRTHNEAALLSPDSRAGARASFLGFHFRKRLGR